RGAGLMLGLKCAVPNTEMVNRLRDAGLLTVTAGDNTVRVLPPLIIEESHVEEALAILDKVAAAWPVPARGAARGMAKANAARVRHFLDLDQIERPVLRHMLEVGTAYKQGKLPNGEAKPLAGKAMALIFEKPSTRTRVSFELGMRQLGGDVIMLDQQGS